MLQSPPLSKVYDHGHIKKFWLMQNQKESESKALVASPSVLPSRHGTSSAGLGHESKQGPQFSLGNATSRSLCSPSGVSIRSIVSGPSCFNMAMAGHTSLVTCAKSLSPPVCTDQPRSLLQPSSPSSSASISKEDKSLAEDDDPISMGSSGRGDEVSASTSQCDSHFGLRHHLTGDVPYSYSPTSKDVLDSSVYDHFSLSKEHRHDNTCSQERFYHASNSDNISCKSHSLNPYKCSMRIFSNSDSSSPFAVPFQLPEKYFLEAEGKLFDEEPVIEFSDRTLKGKNGPSSASLLLDCGPGKRELTERICVNTWEVSKDEQHPASVSGSRTCSLCGTSKTPLWRSGPQGPKSLCNACGIRFKKAKRSSGEGSPLPSPQYMKSSLKPTKRKQDTTASSEAHFSRPLVFGAPMSGLATQVAKKRRWSKLIKKGEWVAQKCEVTGSSGESSLTWNLHSPLAVSSPSVTQFERLSIDENATALDMVAGKDEEEAAVLLMYMSCGLVFA